MKVIKFIAKMAIGLIVSFMLFFFGACVGIGVDEAVKEDPEVDVEPKEPLGWVIKLLINVAKD